MTAAPTDVALVVVWRGAGRDRCVLITRRTAGSHLAGLWEFPGGKVEAGEMSIVAAARELREETGIVLDPADLAPLITIEHTYADRAVRLHVFVATMSFDERAGMPCEPCWVAIDRLQSLDMPEANGRIVEAIVAHLSDHHPMS